nr:P105 [Sinohyriopsis cumingii]
MMEDSNSNGSNDSVEMSLNGDSEPVLVNGYADDHIYEEDNNDQPYIEIVEQPQARGFRFRYECEGPSHGGLQGEKSEKYRRTYPSIRIRHYTGAARIVVTLVTDDQIPSPRAHKLVGKNCHNGICVMEVKAGSPFVQFPNLCVQHVTRKKASEVLEQRIIESIKLDKQVKCQNLNVDISLTDEEVKHARSQAEKQAKEMQLNVVRLCFQAYLRDEKGLLTCLLSSVVSTPIYDSKSPGANALKICRMDKYGGCCTGNEEVFLLCEKVQRDDIAVKFVEQDESGNVIWESFGNFGPFDVHRQYAIVFKTPAYRDTNIDKAVNVWIMLQRKSDQEVSDPKSFTYYPQAIDKDEIVKKRKKTLHRYNPGSYEPPLFSPGGGSGGGNNQQTSGQNGHVHNGIPTIVNMPVSVPIEKVEQGKPRFPISGKKPITNIGPQLQQYPQQPFSSQQSNSWYNSMSGMPVVHPDHMNGSPSSHMNRIPSPYANETSPLLCANGSSPMPYTNRHSPTIYANGSSPASNAGSMSPPTNEFSSFPNGAMKPNPYSPPSLLSSPSESDLSEHGIEIDCSQINDADLQLLLRLAENPAAFELNPIPKLGLEGNTFSPFSSGTGTQLVPRCATRGMYKAVETTRGMQRASDGFDEVDGHFESKMLLKEDIFHDEPSIQPKGKADSKSVFQSRDVPLERLEEIQIQKAKEETEMKPKSTNTQSVQPSLTQVKVEVAHTRNVEVQTEVEPLMKMVEQTAQALQLYAATGDVRILLMVQRYLALVQDQDGDLPLHLSLINEQYEVMQTLLDVMKTLPNAKKFINAHNYNYQTPLHLAVITNKPHAVDLLIRAGADTTAQDRHGNLPVHLAVLYGHVECLKALLKYQRQGTTKQCPFPELNMRNFDGFAPVHLAAQKENLNAMKLLVYGKADINLPDGKSGQTPLHHAVEADDMSVAGYLILEASADLNLRRFDGNTSLHIACGRGNVGMVALLMAGGADPEAENCDPLEIEDEDDEEEEQVKEEEKFSLPGHYALDNDKILKVLRGEPYTSTIQSHDEGSLSEKFTSLFVSGGGHTESGFGSMRFASGSDLDKVDYIKRINLSRLLDQSRPGADWLALSDKLGLRYLVEKLASQHGQHSPTRVLLNYYEEMGGTVSGLLNALQDLHREDAIEILQGKMDLGEILPVHIPF